MPQPCSTPPAGRRWAIPIGRRRPRDLSCRKWAPILAGPPLPLGAIDMMGNNLDAYFSKLFDYVCFTAQFNMSGGPAASLPLHWTANGLPVGVQIGADFGNEAVLFRLASQIEAAK